MNGGSLGKRCVIGLAGLLMLTTVILMCDSYWRFTVLDLL